MNIEEHIDQLKESIQEQQTRLEACIDILRRLSESNYEDLDARDACEQIIELTDREETQRFCDSIR